MLTTKFWEKYFKVYDNLNKLLPYHNLLMMIIENARIKPDEEVLDLGSGTGNLSVHIEKMKAKVTGIDYSSTGINIHSQKSSKAKLICHDITTHLPFENNSFDAVVSNNVLYTIPRNLRGPIYSEIFRITRPGGRVVLSNLASGFNPNMIYFDHIKMSIKIHGIFRTIVDLIKLILPTIKIFYYNYLINLEEGGGKYDFFESNEQKKTLELVGFLKVSDDISVYSKQAVINVAYK